MLCSFWCPILTCTTPHYYQPQNNASNRRDVVAAVATRERCGKEETAGRELWGDWLESYSALMSSLPSAALLCPSIHPLTSHPSAVCRHPSIQWTREREGEELVHIYLPPPFICSAFVSQYVTRHGCKCSRKPKDYSPSFTLCINQKTSFWNRIMSLKTENIEDYYTIYGGKLNKNMKHVRMTVEGDNSLKQFTAVPQ